MLPEVSEHKRKIRKAEENLRVAQTSQEIREIERIIIFERIAMFDFKIAILFGCQIYLRRENRLASDQTKRFYQCLVTMETIYQRKPNIRTILPEPEEQ